MDPYSWKGVEPKEQRKMRPKTLDEFEERKAPKPVPPVQMPTVPPRRHPQVIMAELLRREDASV